MVTTNNKNEGKDSKPFSTLLKSSGVARGVAGVAEATPIFQILFNKFGQNIWVKKQKYILHKLILFAFASKGSFKI